MRWLISIIGVTFFIASLVLAILYKYNHFYEFFVFGLFFILYQFTPKKYLDKKSYIKLYFIFVVLGFIVDFVFGLYISKLWYYRYLSNYEYIANYLIIYPFGWFVLLQTYFLFNKVMMKKRNTKKNINNVILEMIMVFFLFASLILTFVQINKDLFYGKIILVTSLTLGILFYFNTGSEKLGGKSYVRDLLENPRHVILTTLIASYLVAIIHELANSFTWQWVYTNWPLNDIKIFGAPIVAFSIGWIFLMALALSAYYTVHD